MKPGRQMDKLIATKVMGWKWNSFWFNRKGEREGPGIPAFSTSYAAAGKLLEHCHEEGISVEVRYEVDGGWSVMFGVDRIWGYGMSFPEALCNAATKEA